MEYTLLMKKSRGGGKKGIRLFPETLDFNFPVYCILLICAAYFILKYAAAKAKIKGVHKKKCIVNHLKG